MSIPSDFPVRYLFIRQSTHSPIFLLVNLRILPVVVQFEVEVFLEGSRVKSPGTQYRSPREILHSA
jgi:hypothetical protein